MRMLPALVMLSASACTTTTKVIAPNSKPSDLIGSWRALPAAFEADLPIDRRVVVTFTSDGSYNRDERYGEPVKTAKFTADSAWLTSTYPDDGDGVTTTVQSYVATSDRLMIGALFPVAEIDGVVGSWHGEQRLGGSGGSTTFTTDLQLNADSTAHEEEHGFAGDTASDGTWTFDQDDVVVTVKLADGFSDTYMQQIDGIRALGGELFERM